MTTTMMQERPQPVRRACPGVCRSRWPASYAVAAMAIGHATGRETDGPTCFLVCRIREALRLGNTKAVDTMPPLERKKKKKKGRRGGDGSSTGGNGSGFPGEGSGFGGDGSGFGGEGVGPDGEALGQFPGGHAAPGGRGMPGGRGGPGGRGAPDGSGEITGPGTWSWRKQTDESFDQGTEQDKNGRILYFCSAEARSIWFCRFGWLVKDVVGTDWESMVNNGRR